jgi:hypothetical protein
MMQHQYDMFTHDLTEIELLQEECRDTRMYADKLRRSFFARMNEQFKLIVELREEIDKLKNPSKEG